MNITKSKELYKKACKHIPGGVNSPVRAFKSVGGDPVFIRESRGSKVIDADGNEYIDYIGSWGPHLFGHNAKFIKDAVASALELGTSFGAPTGLEVTFAELLCSLVPSVELARMVNSGTEATMSAIRLARGFTGRDKIIKFEGCYHGHGDSFLIKAGSGAMTFGVPTSPGVTKGTAADTLTADFNDINSVKKLIDENKENVAAVIIEPIAGNMGVVPSKKEFLVELRQLCTNEGIVLIFDEVMTGFRVAPGGAQELYGIRPDLSTFGKVIGGGLPVGAFGGKGDIMGKLSPNGPVYQAGTLSGNPLATAAGIAVLTEIKLKPEIFSELEKKGARLESGMRKSLEDRGIKAAINRVGSMICLFFTESDVVDFKSASASDTGKFAEYFRFMLDNGIHLAPSQFEAMFVSLAHSDDDINKTLDIAAMALDKIFGK
ncbi:MAG: glutamate-1-semialdehyde 2,1-aminomutase [Candidatus Kapaibacterium sp.]